MLEFIFFLPLSMTIPTIFAWGVFEKAGRKGWETLIPYYNLYVFLKIIKKPFWWYILLWVPYINVFMYMLMLVEIAKCFNKFKLWEQAVAVVFHIFYLPYLGWSKNEHFVDPDDRKPVVKGWVREWVDAIIFAVVAASIIRAFLFEAYTIPTSSMEKSMLVGDYLFVSKIAYGPRIPMTPISFPFVHHTLPFTESTKSFVTWIELPYYRMPGLSKVKHNDPIVFNYPEGDTVSTRWQSNRSYYLLVKEYGHDRVWSDKRNFGEIVARPVDKRENYVKRCIALPGDTLQIINTQVYINGNPVETPPKSQTDYYVMTDGSSINPKILENLNIDKPERMPQPGMFKMFLTKEAKEKIKNFSIVKDIVPIIDPAGKWDPITFPFDSAYKWNRDNYGPIYIPAKGVTIPLTVRNLPLFERLITIYEGNTLEVKGNTILINGKPADSYTPRLNYYWMMGDNRHNSMDSRYWGYVPEDHIVGKPELVWLSIDKNRRWFEGKIRWNRLFTIIK